MLDKIEYRPGMSPPAHGPAWERRLRRPDGLGVFTAVDETEYGVRVFTTVQDADGRSVARMLVD